MSNARARRKMSLDRGYVPTKRQREIEKAFFKRGGRHPFYMSHIAAGSGLRESWEHRTFTKQRMARRLHVSPRGTYFWLAGLDPLVGCYLRADGSTQAFYGPRQPPLTCIGCGDASTQREHPLRPDQQGARGAPGQTRRQRRSSSRRPARQAQARWGCGGEGKRTLKEAPSTRLESAMTYAPPRPKPQSRSSSCCLCSLPRPLNPAAHQTVRSLRMRLF